MSWQHATDLPAEQRDLVQEIRTALGDLDHHSAGEGPVLVAPGTDGHVRLILGPTDPASVRRAWVAEQVAARLVAAGLRLTVDPDRLAEGLAVRVARPGGRPEVGRPVMVRLPDELLTRLDGRAGAAGTSRAALIRHLLEYGLDGLDTTKETTMDTYGILTDYRTGAAIRPATAAEHAQSLAAGETGAYRDDDGRSVFVAGGPEGITGTATTDVVGGRITVDTPGATDIDIYVLPSGMLGLIAEVEPWGVDELGMERADQALAGLGWERTGDWAGEAAGQQWTAPVRPLRRA